MGKRKQDTVIKLKTSPTNEQSEGERRQRVQSVEIGMQILKSLALIGHAAQLKDISAAVNMPPAKVHRYLASFIETGFVEQTNSGTYRLGVEAMTIGLAALGQSDFVDIASEEIKTFRDNVNASCFVAVMGNKGPTIVRWEDSTEPIIINVKAGSVLPILWSATGRIFAAYLENSETASMVAQDFKSTHINHKDISDEAALSALLQSIRDTGYARVENVLLKGVSALAVPVFDFRGELAGAITAIGASGLFNPAPEQPIGEALIQAGLKASQRLGYCPADA